MIDYYINFGIGDVLCDEDAPARTVKKKCGASLRLPVEENSVFLLSNLQCATGPQLWYAISLIERGRIDHISYSLPKNTTLLIGKRDADFLKSNHRELGKFVKCLNH
jgi:hypothetical protein